MGSFLFPAPTPPITLTNVHFEALVLAPIPMLFIQFLDAAHDGRADDMVRLLNEGIDKDFVDYWVRDLVCWNLAIDFYGSGCRFSTDWYLTV